MGTQVKISGLTRPQLERLALFQQGALKQLVAAVQDDARPWWEARKEARELADKFSTKTVYVRDIAVQQAEEADRRAVNDYLWDAAERRAARGVPA